MKLYKLSVNYWPLLGFIVKSPSWYVNMTSRLENPNCSTKTSTGNWPVVCGPAVQVIEVAVEALTSHATSPIWN